MEQIIPPMTITPENMTRIMAENRVAPGGLLTRTSTPPPNAEDLKKLQEEVS